MSFCTSREGFGMIGRAFMESNFIQSFRHSFNFCFALLLSIPLLIRNFCSYILTIILSISPSVITSNPLTAPSMDATSNSTLSSSSPPSRWDVFLSYRGKDTRANFTAHLYNALDQAGIITFKDDPKLEKGEEISPALLEAIHSSKMSVVVLSVNYAYSPWCLDELVEILSYKRRKNHVVIPVYYYVDPSDLRHQKGTFGEALEIHKKRYSVGIIKKWRSALAEIAEISGYHLKNDANVDESDTIQQIVSNVAPQASTKVLHLEECLPGINSAVEEIFQKLSMESNDVRAIGICGMGGIGKTTIAKAFYNKYSNIFDMSCFIENAEPNSQGGSPLLTLLEKILIKLLKKKDYKVPDIESGKNQLKRILRSNKALVVLDNMDQSSHLESLMSLKPFFVGSRIIITTKDTNVLKKLKVDIPEVDIYKVNKLGEIDSLELFSYHAFGKVVPPDSFKELSEGFVSYAEGLPLALKVLGSSLRGRTEVSYWKAKLEIVQKFPEKEIQSILQMGYDGLDNQTQKDIFLDIAFFFVGRDRYEAVHIFNSCGFLPDAGIPILVERCLLTIDEDNKFQMHSLIQDMGIKLGKSRGLFWQGNEWEDLQNLKQTNKIEGLILDLSASRERQMSAEIFKSMPKLRLLEIIGSHDIKGNFDNSFRELRCIRWSTCPWTRLPSDFRPRKLVSLDMPYNSFNTLWNDATPLASLKTIDLSYSRNLKMTPDFTDVKMVDKLLLGGCKKLLEVHSSIGQLTGLSHLDLHGCEMLKQLPGPFKEFCNLQRLDLWSCINLKSLPENLGDMKGLKMIDASCTSIKQLPDSIAELKELVELNLFGCLKLNKLPEQIGNMESLSTFDASCSAIEQLPDSFVDLINLVKLKLQGCKKLNKLPEQLGDMKGLKMLDASYTAIEQLPDSIADLKELAELRLNGCSKLNKLPEQIGNMEGLITLDASGSAIEQLPDSFVGLVNLVHLRLYDCNKLTRLLNSIWKLKSLKELHLGFCSKLERLPEQLWKMKCLEKLTASGTAIEETPDSIVLLRNLRELDLRGCKKLKRLPEKLGKMQGLEVLDLYFSAIEELPNSIVLLSRLWKLNLRRCWKLKKLPEQLGNMQGLKELYASFTTIEELPDSVVLLSNLETLHLGDCWELKKLPEQLGKMQGLKVLHLSHTSIEELPDSIGLLSSLQELNLGECSKLNKLPEQLEKMQCLKVLDLSHTSIEKVPDSVGLLTNLQELRLDGCWKLQYLPNSLQNLTSFQHCGTGNEESGCWSFILLFCNFFSKTSQ